MIWVSSCVNALLTKNRQQWFAEGNEWKRGSGGSLSGGNCPFLERGGKKDRASVGEGKYVKMKWNEKRGRLIISNLRSTILLPISSTVCTFKMSHFLIRNTPLSVITPLLPAALLAIMLLSMPHFLRFSLLYFSSLTKWFPNTPFTAIISIHPSFPHPCLLL